ncbi:NAD(P)/FAD-dependent oxidoreductase [Methanobacterium sp. ACI-7]|uniref:NAD(P)/FAD-dependent oxidoreductase n=1 Tax=unclassified Methanobacterium TaxID=2627676 RepID=UPI0039C19F94
MNCVKILGAGPAGLTAAINLAKAGYEVNVFEKNKNVGQRFKGDLEGLENWSEKEDILDDFRKMNIDINFDCDPFKKIIATNGLKTKEIRTPRPLYYLIKRGSVPGSMDLGFRELAENMDVNIYFNETIPENEADIVATGPISENVVGIVKGITFKTGLEDTGVMLFNDEAAFKGYSYFFTTKGYGCMSTVLLDNFNTINTCFKRTEEFFSNMLDFDVEKREKCGGVGCFTMKKRFKEGNKLFVGEAAGLQDFLWGFGIRYAVTSGYLAARSIITGEDYEKMINAKFGAKLKAGIVNRYFWEKMSKTNYSFILNNGKRIIGNLRWISNYNTLHRIMYPFALKNLKKRYNWLK